MTLIKCPECEREISEQAMTCPHCGVPLKHTEPNTATNESPTPVLGIIGIISGLGMLIFPLFIVFLLPVSLICGIVAYRKGQRTTGTIAITIAALILCWVIVILVLTGINVIMSK